MRTRLKIVHSTGFRYDGPVAASYNEARMSPITTPDQMVLAARVNVDPVTWTMSYWDYWGTQVTAFDVLVPHRELSVVSSSTVEIDDDRAVPQPVGWETLRTDAVTDTHVEFLAQTSYTTPAEEVVALAREAVGTTSSPDEAARALVARLREDVEFVTGSTTVQTGAAEVWARSKGVCQDFAHLSVGALRSIGIPARYVSGYLHPRPDAEIGQTVTGESHAWVEWWTGDWVPFDPTSVGPAVADHVVVARGRDYSDVAPLKGIYAGPSESELFVSVEVTRLF